jgi:hypothetical protein
MAKAAADIRSLARSHSQSAIKCLAGIMNQPNAPASARVSAAVALMERGWGRADKHINMTLPDIAAAADMVPAIAAVIKAVSEGTISPAEGGSGCRRTAR